MWHKALPLYLVYTSKIIVYTDSVEFTVKIEEHDERLDKLSLINKRVKSIKENIKKNKITDIKTLSDIRTLLINGYNPDEILSINYYINKDFFKEYIPINYDKIPDIKINSEEYKNIGVKHIHIYNPFIDDTACELYFEESKSLKDFIIELQEENSRYKKQNKKLKEINEEHKKLNGKLREENTKYKEVIKKVKKMIIDNIEETTYEYIGSNKIKVLLELRMDNDGVNKLLDILKDVE